MREKYYNKRFLSVVIIAEIITFILINFVFYFAGRDCKIVCVRMNDSLN